MSLTRIGLGMIAVAAVALLLGETLWAQDRPLRQQGARPGEFCQHRPPQRPFPGPPAGGAKRPGHHQQGGPPARRGPHRYGHPGGPDSRGPQHRFRPPPLPLMVALDTDGDGNLSAEEMKQAAEFLKKLDQDSDGKLSREELRPQFRSPEVFKLLEDDLDLERQTRELVFQYRRAAADRRAAIRQRVEELVEKHFRTRQQRHRLELKRLEEELKRLRDAIERRERVQKEIVTKRVAELLGEHEAGF